jgi:hypothetical protein
VDIKGIFDGIDMSVVTPLKDAVAKKNMAATPPQTIIKLRPECQVAALIAMSPLYRLSAI